MMDITWYNMKLTIVLYWLVVWNMTYFSIQLGMSLSQLTFIFFRGIETTNQSCCLWNLQIYGKPNFQTHPYPHVSAYIARHRSSHLGLTPVSRLTAWWHVAVENGAMGRVFPTPCRSQRQDPQPVSSNMAIDAMDKPHMRFEWGNYQWGMFHCHVWLQEGKSSSNWKGLFYLQRWP